MTVIQFLMTIHQQFEIKVLPDGRFHVLCNICKTAKPCEKLLDAIADFQEALSYANLSEYNIVALPTFSELNLSCDIPEEISEYAKMFGLTIGFRYADCDGNWMANYDGVDERISPGIGGGNCGRGHQPSVAINDYFKQIRGKSLWLPYRDEKGYRKYANFTN